MSFMSHDGSRRVMMTQVKLFHVPKEGTREETTVWLEADKRIRVGLVFRLKGDDRWWTIEAVYTTAERKSIHNDWKVGGIEEGCCR